MEALSPAARARARRVAKSALAASLGLATGLALAEGAFFARDRGAFPHLNVYVADASLGVRLRPHATTRVSFGGNAVTSVRVDAEGYRGEGRAGDDDVLVLGDSQTFGLGVEENETFSAVLARSRPASSRVRNGGVPTYGPHEYAQARAELVARHHPKTVVYVVNLLNDLFEVERPNVGRHAVWDGWAVRRELAPARVREFPGRDWLFGRSHAVFALRQTLYYRDGLRVLRTPSEGDASDLLRLATDRTRSQQEAMRATEAAWLAREEELRAAEVAAINADQRVKATLSRGNAEGGAIPPSYLAAGANPGDIVIPQLGEEGSPLAATTKFLEEAAATRNRLETRLRAEAQRDAENAALKAAVATLETRDELEKRLVDLQRAPLDVVRASQPITRAVLAEKQAVEAAGARFVLLVLPMDVQVSADEWRKYGESPHDVSASEVFARDLVATVREAGGTAVDPTEALRKGSPGAFLDKDPHLSVKGHDIVGRVLAEALAAEPRPVVPTQLLALPEGRSRVPRLVELLRRGDLLVHGSSAAGCQTKRLREWVYVRCAPVQWDDSSGFVIRPKPGPTGMQVLAGGHGEVLTFVHEDVVTLLAPIGRGDSFRARFQWPDVTRDLIFDWPKDAVATEGRFEVVKDAAPLPKAAPTPPALLACLAKEGIDPRRFLGSGDLACVATWPDDCRRLVGCAEGNPALAPRCPPGQIGAGAALRCFAACDASTPCGEGLACTTSQGASLCLPR